MILCARTPFFKHDPAERKHGLSWSIYIFAICIYVVHLLIADTTAHIYLYPYILSEENNYIYMVIWYRRIVEEEIELEPV